MHRRNQKGFSVVEVIFVAAMIGVMAVTAIPSFKVFKKQTADLAAESDLINAVKQLYAASSEEGSNHNCILTDVEGPGAVTPSIACPEVRISLSSGVVIQYLFSGPDGAHQVIAASLYHRQGDYEHIWWDVLGVRRHEQVLK